MKEAHVAGGSVRSSHDRLPSNCQSAARAWCSGSCCRTMKIGAKFMSRDTRSALDGENLHG